jgi:hypothetical protein
MAREDKPMRRSEARTFMFGLIISYLVWVGITSVLKITTSVSTPTWPEMIYGPAITVTCVAAMLAAVNWIANRIRH